MKKNCSSGGRVLARRLARELSAEELKKSSGNGTSYRSTDYGFDVEGCDCCEGPDRMV
jgi:hypothetical protein